MASPSTVITLGFGSFGGVNLLPTLGYGSDQAVESTAFSMGWFSPPLLADWDSPASLTDWTSPPALADWSTE